MVAGGATADRILIGPIEYVRVIGHHGEAQVKGKVDTGASRTSVDVWLAAKIGLGPTVDVAKVKSALLDRVRTRPVVRGIIEVGGLRFALPVTVNDRSDMRYRVLIGMDILKSGRFLIDPTKKILAKHSDSNKAHKIC
ncbi:MAG TPA: RimK/LysX family protein [Candidatus Bathyarchaeia archaeon]|nr:RimK/LysX family protein [Candidatus Bathyarchaeia archaeon]